MKKQIICIACPIGCILDVEYEGKAYLRHGLYRPEAKPTPRRKSQSQKVVTTVKLRAKPRRAVKTSKPIERH